VGNVPPSAGDNRNARHWAWAEARDELFERFPYGLFAAESSGRVLAMNAVCETLVGHTRDALDASALSCCDLVCDHLEGPDAGRCLSEEATEASALLPELRIDLPDGSAAGAAWVVVSRLDDAGNILFQLRPGEAGDRRRRTEPHWLAGPKLRIFTLGQTRVESGEGPIPGEWIEQRPGQLLKYLVAERGEFVSADQIAEALWPTTHSPRLTSVRYFVHALRDKLEPARQPRTPSSFVLSRRGGYTLDGQRVWVDADEFEQLVASGLGALASHQPDAALNQLTRAIGYYRGDFLTDEPYAEWALAERERLREVAGRALRALAELEAGQGELVAAARHARRLADMEPYDADAQHRHIEICMRSGRRSEAARRYSLFRRRMIREFGVEPDFQLSDLQAESERGYPPATAGRMVTSSPSESLVSRPSWKRMSSPDT
jgi:DNA-binding SARP family transcriptional activator